MASEIGHQKAEGRIIFQSERIVEPEAATDVVLSVARMGALPPGVEWPDGRQQIGDALRGACAQFDTGPQPSADDGPQPETQADKLCGHLEQYENPPFTIQRLCELILEPKRHYKTMYKFANACGMLLTVSGEINLAVVALPVEDQAAVVRGWAALRERDEEYWRRKAAEDVQEAAQPDAIAAAATAALAVTDGMDVMPGSPGTAPWGAAGAQQTGEADSGAAAGNGENKEPDTQAPITKSATDKEQLKGGDESAPKRARTVEDEDGNGATNGGAGGGTVMEKLADEAEDRADTAAIAGAEEID